MQYILVFQIRLIVYWFFIVLTAFAIVAWKSHHSAKLEDSLTFPNIIVRKVFHILAVAIFVPGILYDPSLLHLCSSVAASLFLLIEVNGCLKNNPNSAIVALRPYCMHIVHLLDQLSKCTKAIFFILWTN